MAKAKLTEGRRRLLDRSDKVRASVIDRAVARGCDREEATETLATLEAERPLLDWLFLGGGLEKIIELIVLLLMKTTADAGPKSMDSIT